jgi:hemolysin D
MKNSSGKADGTRRCTGYKVACMKPNKKIVNSAREMVRSARNVVAFPNKQDRRNREEMAFLPAALEIVETPPSPIGRIIALIIALFFCIAIAWASFGTVDIIASAKGKIIPSGRTKVVQPFETGVVRAIHVRDGQIVKAGEVLIELDPTLNDADTGHIKNDLVAVQLDITRLRAAASDQSDPLVEFHPPAGAPPGLVTAQRQLLVNQSIEYRSKLAALDGQKAQREAERLTIAATVNKLEATIPILQERVDIKRTLFDREIGSKANFLEIEQALVDMSQDLLVQKSRYNETNAALSAIIETRKQTVAEHQHTLFTELTEAERKAVGLERDLDKVNEKTRLQKLTAPVDGIVQQLAVHTVGGIVTPAQALMVIVPSDSHLEVEAMISNRDIGFVHQGQSAEIKIDTFNFTRYGLLHGEILSISTDAIVHDKPQDKNSDSSVGAENDSSEPRGQELVYAARIRLDKTQMQVEDKLVNLVPGMAVTVEMKTGARTVMSYLLSPITRYSHESLRER